MQGGGGGGGAGAGAGRGDGAGEAGEGEGGRGRGRGEAEGHEARHGRREWVARLADVRVPERDRDVARRVRVRRAPERAAEHGGAGAVPAVQVRADADAEPAGERVREPVGVPALVAAAHACCGRSGPGAADADAAVPAAAAVRGAAAAL